MTYVLVSFLLLIPSFLYASAEADVEGIKIVFTQDLPVKELSEKCDREQLETCGTKHPFECSFSHSKCMHTDMKNPPKPIQRFQDKKLECHWETHHQGDDLRTETVQAVIEYPSGSTPGPLFKVKFQSQNLDVYEPRGVRFGGYWLTRYSKNDVTIYKTDKKNTVAGGTCNSKHVYNLTEQLAIGANDFEIRTDFQCSYLIFFKKSYYEKLSCRIL